MNKDIIYAFDKLTKQGTIFGEVQSGFNMSLTIDGTKDSSTIIVWSFEEHEIEPYAIIYHPKTLTWWIVAHDKVERYANENGFIYVHNLQLQGAIELLNARDLTDCGFNAKEYTVGSFIRRLFELSSFEYDIGIDYIEDFLDTQVDFIKTFENYTLLSALREFLDAYNMCPKLYFDYSYDAETNTYLLLNAKLKIISKTSSNDLLNSPYLEENFDDVRETQTMDKNSFGTTVVSNAENVINAYSKTFPAVGSVRLSSKQYYITTNVKLNDAVIRLPSKVFKCNWIKIIYPLNLTLNIQGTITHTFYTTYLRTNESFEKVVDFFKQKILVETGDQSAVEEFSQHMDKQMKSSMDKASCVTLYDGNNINSFTGDIEKGENVPYLAKFRFGTSGNPEPAVFTDISTKNCLKNIKQGIAWERGSNLITGFDMLSGADFLAVSITDFGESQVLLNYDFRGLTYILYFNALIKEVTNLTPSLAKQLSKVSFVVNYIPMSDLKIKVDNDRDKKDIQLYNQNGKITDNFASSKLLNSYAKEISSDTITKYMYYKNFYDVPKLGGIVMKDQERYVINNISLDFSQNESVNDTDFEYFIEAEITMSKWVSTKSLMVNPNTNIRDYGIPQNFNVKRKQLYRDYYEFGYDYEHSDTPYLPLNNIINFGEYANEEINFICVMKLTYDHAFGEGNNVSDTWYYQLETTQYKLNKMLYVVCDFNDNNIIGYGSQNVFSGFDISRIFNGLTDNVNTPISYVDEKGKFDGIDLLFCGKNEIQDTYNRYEADNGDGSYSGSLYNYSVFIPQEIYEYSLDNYSIRIEEENYNKDALEVPVFEYACQIADSRDVIIGDKILNQYQDYVYFYSYIQAERLNEFAQTTNRVALAGGTYEIYNSAKIDTLGGNLIITLLRKTLYDDNDSSWIYDNEDADDVEIGKDLAIFRHALNTQTGEEIVDLLFVAKNIPSGVSRRNVLNLRINNWKLN